MIVYSDEVRRGKMCWVDLRKKELSRIIFETAINTPETLVKGQDLS